METTTTARPWWALVGAAVALGIAGWLLVTSGSPPAEDTAASSPMLQVAPDGTIALADLPADHQRLYKAAVDDPEAFTQVRCYCGCETFLDHRYLYDCFVRPDGGWERHATGCAVCLAEAQQVLDLRADSVPIDEIATHIDLRFGGITEPTDA